ncbi:putative sulfate exporter family transporter [Neobacillus niacini]|uniref:YeiH family protein n=1 Tax=Neobacillus niacini TaxID=86668 RepID=UPI002FFFAB1C
MSTEGLRAITSNNTIEQVKKRATLNKFISVSRGVLLTLVLAMVAGQIGKLPFFSIMGIMIISILLGISWKIVMKVLVEYVEGINFSSKYLLRLGIILMGIRLNIQQIVNMGFSVILIDIIVIVFTLVLVFYLGKWTCIDKSLAALIGVGTAVCGAAAIVAVAPLIKAKKEYIALSVACISILGTIVTIIFTFVYPSLDLDPILYGY